MIVMKPKGHTNERKELPQEARAIIQHATEKLEEEKQQAEDMKYTVQGDTGKRYYEGIIRGIDSALLILMGESDRELKSLGEEK